MDSRAALAYPGGMTAPPGIPSARPRTPPHIVTLVLMAGVGAMNMAVFLPVLPEMTRHFGTDYAVMQLSVSLYLGMTAVLQLFLGPLSDRFGRRPVTLASLAIFVVAVLGCAAAPTIEAFLILRMISGTVSAGLVLSRAIVRDMVPQNEAASMIGYVTMGMALVPMAAPMIGGALGQVFGWQAIFHFLALSGIAVFALCWVDLGETAAGGGRSFAAQVRDYPELFASPRFWGYVFAAAFASGSFFAFLGGAPYVASSVYGLSAVWAGIGFGAPPVGYVIGNFLSGRYSVRFGINAMILAGTAITAAGMCLLVLGAALGAGSAVLFFGLCTTIGIGNGMVIPNASAGMLSVRPHLAGTASGLGSAMTIGGGAALSVLAGAVTEGRDSALPLAALMLTSSLLALAAILFVLRRERQIAPPR